MIFTTPDLSDKFPRSLAVELQFRSFGARAFFAGPAFTIQCYEDNSLVSHFSQEEGRGRIMVVDGGGSLKKALLGDNIAGKAALNGWSGFVINAAVRDIEILKGIDLGILALGVSPVRTKKRGAGFQGITLNMGGVSIHNGDYIYADGNGVIVSRLELST